MTAAIADRPAGAPPARKRTWVKWVLLVICLGLAAMWVYALFFAEQKAPNRVDDTAWRERTEQICKGYDQQRRALTDTSAGYITNPTPEQMRQRADVVDKATDFLEAALRESTAQLPASARDKEVIGKYTSYWNTLIADRRAYTAGLRGGTLVAYSESVVNGTPVSNLITDFTVVNGLKSCAPPNELGTS